MKQGDWVLCPGKGLGILQGQQDFLVNETSLSYYVVDDTMNGCKHMIPINREDQISTVPEDLGPAYKILKSRKIIPEKFEDLRRIASSGDIFDLARVVCHFSRTKVKRDLRRMENDLFTQCLDSLIKIFSSVERLPEKEAETKILEALQTAS